MRISLFFGDPNALHVIDIWDSKDNFEAFGRTLMPILKSMGIDPGEAKLTPVHNVIVGARVPVAR